MRKEKMNNKGFSLIELIIAIAIMAVLVVILAPQYVKYVERSRNSTDYQNATSIVNALQIYIADPDAQGTPFTAGSINVTLTQNAPALSSAQTAAFEDAMHNAGLDWERIRCVSRSAWTQYQIQITIAGNGDVTFSYASDNAGGADEDPFAVYMGTPDADIAAVAEMNP